MHGASSLCGKKYSIILGNVQAVQNIRSEGAFPEKRRPAPLVVALCVTKAAPGAFFPPRAFCLFLLRHKKCACAA
ncbi:MAG TPA: hypothetical protein DDW78_02055 [Treponema sp.]|nr:hypothetical protein [Treponema sp.]